MVLRRVAVLLWTPSGELMEGSAEIIGIAEPAEFGDMIDLEVGIFQVKGRLLDPDGV